MDIPPKLNEWSTKVAQPYLTFHDPKSLEIDTINHKWTEHKTNDPMDIDHQGTAITRIDGTTSNTQHGVGKDKEIQSHSNLPPDAYPSDSDPDNLRFGFKTTKWIPHPPSPTGPDWFKPDERYRREANGYAYRQHGDASNWNRYSALGFFVFEDCKGSDKIWANKETDSITLHRSIWYNFMVHVDNDIEIPQKLNFWAMEITHAYLA